MSVTDRIAELLLKAKDISKLQKKQIINKRGHAQTVYVGDNSKPQEKKSGIAGMTLLSDYIGGSTGAKLYQDKDGDKWVAKYNKNSPDQHKAEYEANEMYRNFSVNVPQSKIVDGHLLTAFVEGKNLKDYKEIPPHIEARIKDKFLIDALLANWDVVGLNNDNIIIDSTDNVWRVDNGGALDYRAQGAKKDFVSDSVPELQSMRRGIFKDITDADIERQYAYAVKSGDWFAAETYLEKYYTGKYGKTILGRMKSIDAMFPQYSKPKEEQKNIDSLNTQMYGIALTASNADKSPDEFLETLIGEIGKEQFGKLDAIYRAKGNGIEKWYEELALWRDAELPTGERLEKFKKWFGDSKVTDKNGNPKETHPIKVYHATMESFTEFDDKKIGSRDLGFFGRGFYFTADKDYAKSYLTDDSKKQKNIIRAYLKIENPYVVDVNNVSFSYDDKDAVRKFFKDFMPEIDFSSKESIGLYIKNNPNINADRLLDFAEGRPISLPKIIMECVGAKKFTEMLRAKGYDGVIVNTPSQPMKEIVAFKSHQIKSVSAKEFDPESPNIYKSTDRIAELLIKATQSNYGKATFFE